MISKGTLYYDIFLYLLVSSVASCAEPNFVSTYAKESWMSHCTNTRNDTGIWRRVGVKSIYVSVILALLALHIH